MKCLIWMFVFVLAIGFVCAADEWGDINDGNNSGDVPVVTPAVNNSGGDVATDVDDYVATDYSDDKSSWIYTDNFYIALGLGGFGLLIVIYFIYMFLRKPRNKWKS